MIKLTQQEADDLIEMAKEIEKNYLPLVLPYKNKISYEAKSVTTRHKFNITINHSAYNTDKITIQGMVAKINQPLLRIDICPQMNKHKNPNGEIIRGSHIHIYKEEHGLDYAEKFDPATNDLTEICKIFFEKFCIINAKVSTQIRMEI